MIVLSGQSATGLSRKGNELWSQFVVFSDIKSHELAISGLTLLDFYETDTR